MSLRASRERIAGRARGRRATDILLLDEPTTFLDSAHQVEVLDLCAELPHRDGRTVAMVLHDINQACRYATHLIAMCEGRVVAEGAPATVVTAELIHAVFGLPCHVIADPATGTPFVIPAAPRGHRNRNGAGLG